jgi:hypothetical protein
MVRTTGVVGIRVFSRRGIQSSPFPGTGHACGVARVVEVEFEAEGLIATATGGAPALIVPFHPCGRAGPVTQARDPTTNRI